MRQWDPKANEIFVTAMGFESVEERQRYVQDACCSDAQLKHQVISLMDAASRAESFLEQPVAERDTTAPSNSEPHTGSVFGPYKLLEVIGEGGMGIVYMAEQTDPVHRKVALKIIKAGMDTTQVIARFEAERQALAVMDHPNIAKVFDAGSTETGRPYFAMELVKGVPITKFCDGNRLTPRDHLELFIQVCHAVQHAHQKGIIHRDLKPTNVLIALYDDKPVPKVIDFGVAKAAGERLTEKTMFTHFGQVIGTLEYMSPEQAQLNQLDIDTRSDIYSLGAILYELLTGGPPFEKDKLKREAFDEILRMIREDEPPKPSTKVSASGTAPTNRRSVDDPGKLSALIRGDLDWIVMKALEKDRRRRYETAHNLALDIQRHLNDEPVIASPPSSLYRFSKFVRRNKLVFGTSVAIAAALVIGLAFATSGFISAVRSRNSEIAARLGEQKQRVAAESAKKEAVIQRNEAIKQRNIATQQANRTRANSILVAASNEVDPLVQALLLKELAEVQNMPRRLGVARTVANRAIPKSIIDISEDLLIGREIALSPDGQLMAASMEDGTRIWRTDGFGEPVEWLAYQPSESRRDRLVRFSSDGSRVVSVWQNVTRILNTDGSGQPIVFHHENDVLIAEFSPNSQQLLTVTLNGTVKLWRSDLTGGPLIVGKFESTVSATAFSTDGSLVAVSSINGLTRISHTDGSGTPADLKVPAGRIDALAFSPDGTEVAIFEADKSLPEPHDRLSVWPIDGMGEPRVCVRARLNGGTTQLWQAESDGETIALTDYLVRIASRFPPRNDVMAVSLDGKLWIEGYWSDEAKIYKGLNEVPLVLSNGGNRVVSAAFNSDGTTVAIAGDGPVRIWSLAGHETEPLVFNGHHDTVQSVAISTDGALVATASRDGTARVWRSDLTGDVLVFHHQDEVTSVGFSSDNTRLVTASRDGAARIWTLDGTNDPRVLLHDGPLKDADFSPDGMRVVTASQNGTARIWNADGSGEPILLSHRRALRPGLNSVTFSPDGTRVLTGGPGQSAWIWPANGNGEPIELEGYENMRGGDFSPDGKRVVMGCGDGQVRLWNADGTGEPVVRMEHLDEAFDTAFSPDGSRVVSVSEDGTARIWWVDGSRETLVLRGHGNNVTAATFSPDGKQVITASADRTARIWRITWQALLEHFQTTVTTCLTPEQRIWYLGESATDAWRHYVQQERDFSRQPDRALRPPGVVDE